MKRENDSINLVGKYYDNDTATGEISNEMFVYMYVFLEFDSALIEHITTVRT